MRRCALVVCLPLAWAPCGCRAAEQKHAAPAPGRSSSSISGAASATAIVTPTVAPGSPDGVRATAKLVRCGWGSVSADPTPDSPPWAIALVDVELPTDVKGLRITAMELGADHGVVAKMGGRATLRATDGTESFSFGAAGTHELGEALPAGPLHLRAAAALDRPRKQIATRKPTTCSLALSGEGIETLVATGNVDPEWKNE